MYIAIFTERMVNLFHSVPSEMADKSATTLPSHSTDYNTLGTLYFCEIYGVVSLRGGSRIFCKYVLLAKQVNRVA